MNADHLLLWMSARGSGSWPQFRGAVEQLHLEEQDSTARAGIASELSLAWRLRLNLQRIGHAEFEVGSRGRRWRITPPTLGTRKYGRGWMGVLAGGRSPKLLARLEGCVAPALIHRVTTPQCPEHIRVTAPALSMLNEVAAELGLHLQLHAPMALLTSLPAIGDPALRSNVELPVGKDWTVHRFAPRDFLWLNATRHDAQNAKKALFRFSLRHERYFVLSVNGRAFRLAPSVGKYIILSHKRINVVRYDADTQEMSFPALCRPPFLIERALILCSGLMPSYERTHLGRGVLRYGDVPKDVATLALQLLGQGLR